MFSSNLQMIVNSFIGISRSIRGAMTISMMAKTKKKTKHVNVLFNVLYRTEQSQTNRAQYITDGK